MPIISVILPVYNAEKYLDEAIQSILDQTFKDFEFIIINDGSTDGSLSIIEKYQNIDERIILITRENKGLIASLNEGISISKGQYIARMDADDISLPERFAKQVAFMEKNPNIGVCGSWVEVFGENRKTTTWKLPVNNDELKTRLLFSVPVAHPSVIIRKKVIDEYDLRYNDNYKDAEDYKFWLDFSKHTEFANLPIVLFCYRYLETSVSRVADRNKVEQRYHIIKNVFSDVLSELGVQNTEKENQLHFTIGLNERIAKEEINLIYLNTYLNKLLMANKANKIFEQYYLQKYLARKFLIVVYYLFKRKRLSAVNAIFYRIFWSGVFCEIKNTLKIKKIT